MLDDASKTFLLDYLNTPSPTGFEFRGQKKWADYTRQFADRVENDAYGNAWATLEGSSKTCGMFCPCKMKNHPLWKMQH